MAELGHDMAVRPDRGTDSLAIGCLAENHHCEL